ncbi:MAG: 5'-deoxynucleotidase [Oscillospiraceae bacterium]|nr:5'-deoxynucleotidase [Oscillospiraceae bacterium]
MAYNFFALISRMRYIDRWGLMRSTCQENIQEHSHMVAVLAHALALIRLRVFGGDIDPGAAATAALYHDASEILTGDLPTPVKYFNPEIRDAYKQVERLAADRLTELLPPEMQEDFRPLLREELDPQLYAIVKGADKLAAYIKCLEELQAGNREFAQAAEQTRAQLEESSLPEMAYFMEHFLPGFGLTLDELQKGAQNAGEAAAAPLEEEV